MRRRSTILGRQRVECMNRPAIDVSQVQCFTHLQTGCGCFPVMPTKPEQFLFWGQTFNSREIKFLLQHKTRLVKSNNKEVPLNLQGLVPTIKPQVLPRGTHSEIRVSVQRGNSRSSYVGSCIHKCRNDQWLGQAIFADMYIHDWI